MTLPRLPGNLPVTVVCVGRGRKKAAGQQSRLLQVDEEPSPRLSRLTFPPLFIYIEGLTELGRRSTQKTNAIESHSRLYSKPSLTLHCYRTPLLTAKSRLLQSPDRLISYAWQPRGKDVKLDSNMEYRENNPSAFRSFKDYICNKTAGRVRTLLNKKFEQCSG
ncbi:hypothetical protein GALMADRAFT_253460 [Galerina marginata CBS 339.88]|uniref:Uncharacterized protein n=1 Tax=Galerina marginata (strain CBS 339.88) TaxID=685588 RepID=A0A067SLE8_GALM3|nr:hypothetical protein GALMADRAFT_253460 [Galerina marginata CBS 339.88]